MTLCEDVSERCMAEFRIKRVELAAPVAFPIKVLCVLLGRDLHEVDHPLACLEAARGEYGSSSGSIQ